MTDSLQIVSVKLPLSHLRRIRGNRSSFLREAVEEKLLREAPAPSWKPQTALGRNLLRLREKSRKHGLEPLDARGISQELRRRRGGLS
ncbi:MAG: hypothetical protein HC904_12955 [Blastochloris sp.]|nr:hypothetical protein [Blastochloris sp.]